LLVQVLTDEFLAEMQQAVMVPLLKNGLYGEALLAGVRECNTRIRQHAGGIAWLKPPEPKLLVCMPAHARALYRNVNRFRLSLSIFTF
jgi:hypothetical protein